MSLSLYLIIRHPDYRPSKYPNRWNGDKLTLEEITTTPEIARMCREAREHEQRIFIHRSGVSGKIPPRICCSALVAQVEETSEGLWRVRFTSQRVLAGRPHRRFVQSDKFYYHRAPSSEAGTECNEACRTTFSVKAPPSADVRLAGTFSDWCPLSMVGRRDGTRKLSLDLEPGEYQYKFVVDGEWRPDPNRADTAPDGHGSHNSLLRVG